MQVKTKPRLHASWIDSRAKEIVRRLQAKHHTTYLVGGCVRDLLVGEHPKDFDIATSALPNDVRKFIPGAYVIGKRFRLVLVRRGEDQFEVATFRRASRPEDFTDSEESSVAMGDNFFGSPEEDALRRDFTINALFYDPISEELIDYAEGIKDIQARVLRMIGDPKIRIVEDPIRSLRAIRLAHKLGFQIESSLRNAILENAAELSKSALPRRREEYLKLMKLPDPRRAFIELWDLGLIHSCLPSLAPIFESNERAELFFHYIDRKDELTHNSDRPMETLLPLILGFDHASQGLEHKEKLRDQFLRNELSLFKAEAGEIEIAFEMKDRLKNIEQFKKRGIRRQNSFLANPGFSLALRLAGFEHELSAESLWFWKEKLRAVFPDQNAPQDFDIDEDGQES